MIQFKCDRCGAGSDWEKDSHFIQVSKKGRFVFWQGMVANVCKDCFDQYDAIQLQGFHDLTCKLNDWFKEPHK